MDHKAKHHEGSVSVNEVVRILSDEVGEKDEKVDAENVHILVKHTLKWCFTHLFLNTVFFLFKTRHYSIKLFVILYFVDEAFSGIAHLD